MRIITVCAVLIAALFTACGDWEFVTTENHVFAHELRGTWKSIDPSKYSGTLVITNEWITITGYEEGQTSNGGNDDQRPFRDFVKGTHKGYSEEGPENNGQIVGHIYISDANVIQEGIPYTYWHETPPPYTKREHSLRFTFGGRQEVLRKVN